MDFLFNRQYLVTVLKYALLLGISLALFALLKQVIYITLDSWETYASIVAALFLAGGVWLGRIYTVDEVKEIQAFREIPIEELLSRREVEVMGLLLQNKTNQQIADELCIELSTLKTHINKIYKKLEVKNRRELMMKCKG